MADEYAQLGKHIAAGSGFLSNFFLWSEAGYFDSAAATKPLLHLWSLAIEEQFYALWPILLLVIVSRGYRLAAVLIALGLASFAINIWLTWSNTTSAFYSPIPRAWEFMVGAQIASSNLAESSLFRSHRNLLSYIGFSVLAIAFFGASGSIRFPGWLVLLPVVGTSLLLACGQDATINRHILSRRGMVAIGLISYPLYLWHWPLLSFAHILYGKEPPASIRWACIFIAFSLSWLTYRYIETRVRAAAMRGNSVRMLCCTLLVVGILGFFTWLFDGFPFRAAANPSASINSYLLEPGSAFERVHQGGGDGSLGLNRFDRPYKQSCAFLMGEPYEDDWCNIGNSTGSQPNLLVIGDSTGNADSTILESSVVKSDFGNILWRQIGRGQCPMLIGYGPRFCQEITKKAIAYIEKTPSIKTVFMIGDWPIYYRGKMYQDGAGWESQMAFTEAFRRTLDHFKENGISVGIFLAPPFSVADPKSCLRENEILKDKNGCMIVRNQAVVFDGSYREYMLPMLKARGIKFFDPFKYLCHDDICQLVDGRRVLYNDGPHISAFGGEYLAVKGREDIAAMLSTSGR